MAKKLDTVAWFVLTIHQMLGHDKAAAFLGVTIGDKSICSACLYEKSPTPEMKQWVIDMIMRDE